MIKLIMFSFFVCLLKAYITKSLLLKNFDSLCSLFKKTSNTEYFTACRNFKKWSNLKIDDINVLNNSFDISEIRIKPNKKLILKNLTQIQQIVRKFMFPNYLEIMYSSNLILSNLNGFKIHLEIDNNIILTNASLTITNSIIEFYFEENKLVDYCNSSILNQINSTLFNQFSNILLLHKLKIRPICPFLFKNAYIVYLSITELIDFY